jgi:spore maturation protein CgeB
MRIFQVYQSTGNGAVPGSRTWYRNFHETLVHMGHEAFLLPANDGILARSSRNHKKREKFSIKLLSTFLREHAERPFDLFFAYLTDGMVEPAVIDEIRKTGVPTCNFSCNNTHQFHLMREISRLFDYSLHSEKDARDKFLAVDARPLWWPMASNPAYFRPVQVPRTIPVSFVGANYAIRARYIAHLLENGVSVNAYGPGWRWGARTQTRSLAKRYLYLLKAFLALSPERQAAASGALFDHDLVRQLTRRFPGNLHPPVSDEELVALYSKSHLSLGFLEVYGKDNRVGGPLLRHLHLRDFEAPMCGALFVTGYLDELSEHFEPDKEVVVYRNADELLDKVRYHLSHPDEAEKIRRAGHLRALRDHTYQRRFEALFKEIGIA